MNIQDQKKEIDRIQNIAHTDPLTGFRNRSAGMYKIKNWLVEQKEYIHYVAVVDLDKFKDANDKFGHSFGDMVLRDTAARIKESLERGTITCRTGGDEFLIFGNCDDRKHAMEILSKLKEDISHNVKFGESSFDISASIGIAMHPEHGTTLDELYDKADMAMYYAKKNKLKKPAIYEAEMDAIKVANK